MTPRWPLLGFTLALGLAVPQLLAQDSNADSELSLGIAAFGKSKYSEAIDHLERAVTLSPKAVTGHFYLAESYDSAYSEECDWNCEANERRRMRAIEEYNKVLELEPSNTEAMKGLAWRYYRAAKSDEADAFYRKALEVDPNDFEALYTLAVIQWQRSYQIRAEKRADLKLGRNKALINLPSCTEIRSTNLARIEDGISLMTRAAGLVESDDVKAYLSLLYRERADIQCGDRSDYDQDVNTAMEWTRRACDAQLKPDRVTISCTSLRCPLPAPPPAGPGRPGGCPD
jgi:tetratricopeptide (TPR) repeat protein